MAFHEDQLIDHDADQIALLRRIEEQYPGEVVMFGKFCLSCRQSCVYAGRAWCVRGMCTLFV